MVYRVYCRNFVQTLTLAYYGQVDHLSLPVVLAESCGTLSTTIEYDN